MKNLWLFDEKRVAILQKLLSCDAATGCDLRECLKMKKALLSYHLKVLRDKGIVEETKEGRDKYYKIRSRKVPFVKTVVSVVD